MFNSKLYRVFSQIAVLVYLLGYLIERPSIAEPTQGYSRVDALSEDVNRLESNMTALNIQQRLTSLEEIARVNTKDIEKSVAWQDKFQWALIVLLLESIWRLYDQFRPKAGK